MLILIILLDYSFTTSAKIFVFGYEIKIIEMDHIDDHPK